MSTSMNFTLKGANILENIIISDGEWKVMDVLWDMAPCSLATIVNLLEEDTGWSKATVFVMLKRLIGKNAVAVDTSGKVQMYSPLIDRNKATIAETKSFLKKVYGGSIGLMISSMSGQETLSNEEIAELRKILDEAEQKNKK